MNKHTPGPWKIAKRRSIVHDNDGWDVAAVSPRKWDGQQISNARLIAAAPELLEACKAAVAALSQPKIFDADIKAAKSFLNAAIKAAEGGE